MTLIKSDSNGLSSGIVTKSGHSISAEACQDIFQYFTQPKTSLNKDYSNNLKLTFDEIENLNYMILQSLRGENIVGINSSVIVVHKDKSKVIFEGFENFKGYVVGGSSPTRLVVLIYRYVMNSSSNNQLQNYEIKIELNSKLATYERMNEDKLPSAMKSLLVRVMPTVELTIKYEDYLKAKVIVDLVDNWVNGCPTSDSNKTDIVKFFQNHSHTFPAIFSCISVLLIMFYIQNSISSLIPENSAIQEYAIFLIQTLGLSYLIIIIARGVGRLVENFLDFYPFLSYVKINKGDEKLLASRKGRIQAVFLKITATIILGALGSYLMAVICGFFPDIVPKP